MKMAVCDSPVAPVWSTVDDPSTLSDYRDEEGELLWAQEDVRNVTDEVIDVIAAEFELHPLAVEDAKGLRQRPKFEAYENHFFLVLHQLDRESDQLEARQISCFIGKGYVLNIHEGAERCLDEALLRWSRLPPERRRSRTQVIHTLLDVVVDDYRDITDRLEAEVEHLEELVLGAPHAPIDRQLYGVKQRLARLRRYAVPISRSLDWMLEGGGQDLFPRETIEQFRDVQDHVLRITDQVRNIETLADAALNLRRNEQARSLNDTILKLTGWAAIIAVPTWIASVYGMNFSLLPATGSRLGFWFAIGLMVTAGIGLYIYFKRKHWV